ncbi:hypothetical protein K0M31_005153, partial [Melipona bicolor]
SRIPLVLPLQSPPKEGPRHVSPNRPGPRQPNPLPDQARHAPLLRANPYSEVNGSNLPTSLTYINLSTSRLFTLETCCGYGYEPARHLHVALSWIFKVRGEDPDRPPQLRCSSRSKPYLPARGFQGTRTLIQKRKLFPDLPTASPGHFGLPRRTLLRGPEWYAVPLPGSGIGTGFPFAQW